MEVAGYQLERRLGTGGQGTVFRARREGQLFAVKFISLPHAAHWAWRELDVMVKLWRAGGLPLEGHGLWPARQPRFLFLVMPLVRGLPLDVWVRVHNPNALEAAELVRWVARQLAVVHAAGVVHRDVKGANLLVRHEDGRPVLVDFGVATYEGAPTVTGPLPPGTWAYLSPRVWRAWRGEEQSSACPGDDLWALGVELYWLLTGRLPFQGSEGELVHAILHQESRVPHEDNPRVPRALGEVCQRMLRKQPGERYADALAVDAALGEVVKQADEAWKVPLCEPWGPHHATTVRREDLGPGGDLLALYERLASYERRPVRGRPLSPDELSTQGLAEEQPPEPERVESPLPSASRGRWGLGAAGAVLVLGLGMWLAPLTLEPGGQEVAPQGKRLEGDGGAAPRAAPTPAPVARATPSQDTRVKTPPKAPAPPQPPQQPKETRRPAAAVGALALSCALATGCPSATTTSQVRSTPEALPPPAPCPEGAAQTMEELGLLQRPRFPERVVVYVPGGDNYITVRPGPVTMRLTGTDYWGQLPEGTLLSGELLIGERVHGRFTQAYTPDGHTYVVCLELRDGAEWGWRKESGSGQDTARVVNSAEVEPVESFGEAWRYE
jgi:hypothetical protein